MVRRRLRAHRARYGFAGWVPPDAGENAKAENFGGGNAGPLQEGWDEVYTRQVEEFLGQEDLPEPFCLVVSLVNPHDVLGYPSSYKRGGYDLSEFRDYGIELPPSVDEDLCGKPSVHSIMQMGMTAYLGPLRDRQARLDYVNFYAYLHKVIDEKLGRVVGALGDAAIPVAALALRPRPRLRPRRDGPLPRRPAPEGVQRLRGDGPGADRRLLPFAFPQPAETDAIAGLVDITPTLAALAGASPNGDFKGRDLSPSSPSTPARARVARGRQGAPSVGTRCTSPTTTTRPAPR